MFEKILVPVDGSDHSKRAVTMASELAANYGAELTMLHVMEDTGSTQTPKGLENYVRIENVNVSEHDRLRAHANHIVTRAKIQAREAGATTVKHSVKSGAPGRTIVDYAKRSHADLIVMGSRGLGRMSELLHGSVSHRVTQLAGCACLTIK